MAHVKLLSGDNQGKVHDVNDSIITLGRDDSSTIQILDHGVSRAHAEIYRIGEMCFIKDLKSTNGTFVNDRRIEEEILHHNDQVRIGSTIILFEDRSAAIEQVQKQVEFESREEFGTSTVELKLDRRLELKEKVAALGLEQESKNLTTIYEIARQIQTERELPSLLTRILNTVVEATRADAGYVFTAEKGGSGKLNLRAHFEKDKGSAKVSKTIVKRVMQYARSLLTSDAQLDSRFAGSTSVVLKHIKSVICAPLVSHERISGVLYLHSSKMQESFQIQDLELATAVAIQTGMAISSHVASDRVRRTFMSTIKTLIEAMELKDPKDAGHSERVANYAAAIATAMGLPRADAHKMALAGLLHDVGKIALPPAPPGVDPLKHKEEHVALGEKLLAKMVGFDDIMAGIKFHHEKVDGTGYPGGLKGEAIPLMGRVIAVANVFDNLCTYGGAGAGMAVKDVLIDVSRQGGIAYDDAVVKALLVAHQNGTLFQGLTFFED
ncbi:MAG: FHA domain-containing protein [Planctomycetes bacterium]|nr:FHA domain-containing protein [Planctomycetota bacterium]